MESDSTARDQYKNYPCIDSVLLVSPEGLCVIGALKVEANVAPKAHRGHPELAAISVTMDGLGSAALTVTQLEALILRLRTALDDATLARALGMDVP